MAANNIKCDPLELHKYPTKPDIEYKSSSMGTYHYIILSVGYYPSSSILVKSQKKNANCYRIPDNYKVKLKCVEDHRDLCHQSRFLKPIEISTNTTQRN
ncbi:5380_t:CDS:2 [Dentiscutata heterogama]|uniref:5380_t:CDS:1 n=1 Tax=Dentiscutata heterogama TaxID=1316150 RepID=A0ACA9JZ10_9GLOM|nr:5380_t:CDS:2 [Dentiscutata heterogama]